MSSRWNIKLLIIFVEGLFKFNFNTYQLVLLKTLPYFPTYIQEHGLQLTNLFRLYFMWKIIISFLRLQGGLLRRCRVQIATTRLHTEMESQMGARLKRERKPTNILYVLKRAFLPLVLIQMVDFHVLHPRPLLSFLKPHRKSVQSCWWA